MAALPPQQPSGAFETEFTTEQDIHRVCGRCKRTFLSDQVQWMHNSRTENPGRWICADCMAYYRTKGTTRRRVTTAPTNTTNQGAMAAAAPNQMNAGVQVAESAAAQQERVTQQVAAAQRDERQYPVVAVGNLATPAQPLGYAMGNPFPQVMPPPPPPVVIGYSGTHVAPVALGGPAPQNQSLVLAHATPAASGHSQSPLVFKPRSQSILPFPADRLPLNPGYQEAHKMHKEMKAFFQSKAYSSPSNVELVTVRVWLSVRTNKKNPLRIGTVFEAVSNIPVHIGFQDLKIMLFCAILPPYINWSKGFPLSIDQCELRDKNEVELSPRRPDVDVIADRFYSFKGKNKATKVFNGKNPLDLGLFISNDLFETILQYTQAKSDESNLVVSENAFTAEKGLELESNVKLSNNLKRKNKESNASPKKRSAHNLAERFVQDAPVPDVHQVQWALGHQGAPRKKDMTSLLNMVLVSVQFFRLPQISFATLVQQPKLLQQPQNFPSLQATLSYSTSKPLHGAFKIAYIGHSTPVLLGESTQVCIKQAYSTDPQTGKKVVFEGQSQAANITQEINCLGWASALMDVVYGYLKTAEQVRGKPPFEIPQMRYVQSGLAISKKEDQINSYLVEEFIDAKSPGDWFVKYINNDSAKVRPFKNEEQSMRAMFLSFSQHVQYLQTNGLAYVSDMQGGRSLLTDPQIITSPNIMGALFADGNANYETFAIEHDCSGNRFCAFYQLPSIAPDNTQDKPQSIQSDPGSGSSLPETVCLMHQQERDDMLSESKGYADMEISVVSKTS